MIEVLFHPLKLKAVSCGLVGTPWGRAELQNFVVFTVDEPEIEAKLVAMISADRPFPQIDYPYDKKFAGVTEKVFDIAKLPAGKQADALDPLKTKSVLTETESASAVSAKVEAPKIPK